MTTESSPFNKYWRPVLILAVIALVVWLVAISSAVLIPFLIGILIAYLLMPLIRWLEEILPPKGKVQKWKRIISIVIVFVVFLAVIVLFMVYIGSAVIAASGVLVDKAPEFISKSMDQLNEWFRIFRGGLPQEIVERLDSMVANLGPATGKFVQDFMVGSMAVIPASMPTLMGFFILPFFLFFIINDYESFKKYFYEFLPVNSARHTGNILGIIGNVMGRYIRSQIILGLIVGTIVFLGLWILGIEYAPALGAVTAVTQFIPIVGPFISGIIILIITLALQPDKVLWVILVIIIAQILLNTIFLNWIQGKYMQIHPAIVMVLLVVGGYIGGFWGMILALPIAATAWEIFMYFRNEQQADKIQS